MCWSRLWSGHLLFYSLLRHRVPWLPYTFSLVSASGMQATEGVPTIPDELTGADMVSFYTILKWIYDFFYWKYTLALCRHCYTYQYVLLSFLCTGVFLYAPCSFLLISIKFWVRGSAVILLNRTSAVMLLKGTGGVVCALKPPVCSCT